MPLSVHSYLQPTTLVVRREAREVYVWLSKESLFFDHDVLFLQPNWFLSLPAPYNPRAGQVGAP